MGKKSPDSKNVKSDMKELARLTDELRKKNRQLEIEHAVEQVRSRAMSMRSSDELADCSTELFHQLKSLGIKSIRTGLGFFDDPEEAVELWVTTMSEKKEVVRMLDYFSIHIHPVFEQLMEARRKKKPFALSVLKGKEVIEYYQMMSAMLRQSSPKTFSKEEYYYSFFFNEGSVNVVTTESLTREECDLLIRMSNVFGLAYTRFLDLKKAEAQTREAKIEAALERVRSRSMAMQKSQELKDVIQVVYDQFIQLNINVEHTGFIIDYKQRDDMHIWLADQNGVPAEVTIPYFDSPHWNSFMEARKEGLDFFANRLTFKEKNKFYRKLFKFIPGVPEKTRKYYFECPGLAISTVLLDDVGLYMENFSGTPYSEQDNSTLIRFGRVFQQTFTRFLDLQKAEAQAREAQIQLALERVRARTMAMQSSDELAEVSFLLNKQVVELGIPTRGCAFNIYNEHDSTEWFSNLEGTLPTYKTPREKVFLKYYEAGQRGETLLVEEYSGKKIKDHYKYLFKAGILGDVTEEKIKEITPKFQIDHVIYFKYGYLLFITLVPAPHDIFKRFAKEFEQTYTRFLDLQKAEAQARESKIEAALERVRARTMAMHDSQELTEAATVLFQQILSLGLKPIACAFIIANKKEKTGEVFISADGTVIHQSFVLPYHGEAAQDKIFEAWKKGKPYLIVDLRGKALKTHLKFIANNMPVGEMLEASGQPQPDRLALHIINFQYGFLGINYLEPNHEAIPILQRFAKVFEQTYTRFLDLKKVEAQAREAQIEAALERVRASTMAMHKSDDVSNATHVLFDEIERLDIKSLACGLNIIHESRYMETWSSTKRDKKVFQISGRMKMEGHPSMDKLYRDWKAKKRFSIYELIGKDVRKFYNSIYKQQEYHTPKLKKLPKSIFLNNCIIPEGSLWLFSYEELDDEKKSSLERFANVFSLTYSRYKDLQKAEAQAREAQIEAALERVRGRSLAMHKSEELTEVGNMVFQQMKKLGIHAETSWLWFIDQNTNSIEIWATHKNKLAEPLKVKPEDSYTFDLELKAWKRKEPFMKIPIPKAEAIKILRKIFGIQLSRDANASQFHLLQVWNKFGFLGLGTWRTATDEEISICTRFAKVFEQSYTRFLDLQKAEVQAREAQIEAALERVRSKTMAMHTSQDVGNTMVLLFKELVNLGIKAERNGILIMQENQMAELWTARPDSKNKVELLFWKLDMNLHEMPREVYKAWKNKKLNFEFKLKGKSLKAYYKILNNLPDFPGYFDLKALPSQQWGHFFNFNEGCIYLFTSDQIPEADGHILNRFASVFSQTYRRYKDLEKAEAQAREAQIEAALERVRARTMAMHDSAEFGEVAAVLFDQISSLTYAPDRFQIAIVKEEDKSFDIWVTEQGGRKLSNAFVFRANESPIVDEVFQAWKKKKNSLIQHLSGKKLNQWIQYVEQVAGIPFNKKQIAKDRYINSLFFSHGCIGITTNEPPEPALLELIERFTKVFQQTYTRFQDLQKAEAQAREAQIETALERVRSRSMAMHKSEELLEVITVVSEQLLQLNFKFNHVSFANNNIDQDYKFWVSARGIPHPMRFVVPYLKIPVMNNLREAQQKGVTFYTDILTKKENRQWHKHLLNHGGAKVFTEEVNEYSMSRGMARSISIHPNIILILANYASVHYSEDENKIIARLGKVFDQAYTRFLDLQKAEAQAREAQIEAALERVRSRTMAMQHSDELAETAFVLFQQLVSVGVNHERINIGIINEKEEVIDFWVTEQGGKKLSASFSGSIHEPIVLSKIYEGWKSKQKSLVIDLKGKNLTGWLKYLKEDMGIPYNASFSHKRRVQTTCYFSMGMLVLTTPEPIPIEHIKLLERFASVFDLTYKRFNDLQKAEASAREAKRQASLDRVRGEIASMRSTEDLQRINPLVWKELLAMEIPFTRCGVFLIDEKARITRAYLSAPDGHSLGALKLPFDSNELTDKVYQHWKQQKMYCIHWNREQFVQNMQSMLEQGQIQETTRYQGSSSPPESLDLHFIHFKQGMLYVGNSEPLRDEAIESVRTLANSFSIAYSRYEDFKQLEEAKSRVETALSELKSTQTQLIQSEKMASLGELTAGIAHEIQNPLNFVNNFSEVSNELLVEMKEEIEKGNVEEVKSLAQDVIENLEKILHHGKRADGIVKGMLQHSRASSSQKELTDLNVLADEYLRLAFHGMRAKDKSFNAKFETDFDSHLVKLNVVPQDIGRVILNLITNAFYVVNERSKKNKDGYQPTVWLKTSMIGNKVIISVKDNGAGIPDSIKEKIFQPFFTTKPTGQGTGLGLSLSYDIVKAHGGKLKMETNEGEGTIFSIELSV